MFKEVTDLVKEELKHVEYFAATTDMWSSRNNTPFMAFTIHFINSDFELCSRDLQVIYIVTILTYQ